MAPPRLDIRLVRTDLPANHRKPIQEALELLYTRNVKAEARKDNRNKDVLLTEFARMLRMSLDGSFGPHWHVFVGERVGFACKKRNETMGVWRVEENLVVIWQSPGIEVADDEGASASPEPPAAAEPVQPAARLTVKVLEPSELEAGTETEGVVEALRAELGTASPEADVQVLAQHVRRRLTADFGTIWHVVVGTDFALEAAEDRRNHVVVTAGKFRVACFQHEQFKGRRRLDWAKIFITLPYAALGILCFGYMTLNSLCQDKHPPVGKPWKAWLHGKFCAEWEDNLSYVGAAALVLLVLCRRAQRSVVKDKAKSE